MTQYLIRRILALLPVLLVVAVTVFILIHLTPGDPAGVLLGPDATVDDIVQLKATLGLDKPLHIQFVYWVKSMAMGDFGNSIFYQQPVLLTIWQRAEPTLLLTMMSLAVAVTIGIPTGIVSAVKRDSWVDQALTTFALLGASIPSFWLGLILILLFAVILGWAPSSGYSALKTGLAPAFQHLILPAIALGFPNSALITRITRSTMLDVMDEDYIRTARAKGLTQAVVMLKHAFKNTLIPVITVVGLTFAILMGGAVVTETVFGLPGVGRLIVSSVLRRDYPVIQGSVIVVAFVYVTVNLLVDLSYLLIDRRVKY